MYKYFLSMKFKLIYWMGIAALFFLGCSGNTIIPKKDMILILKQIYMTDGVVSISESNLAYKDTIAYYEPILEKYGYTTEQFDSSIKYYARRTEELDELLDKVILELSKQQELLDKADLAADLLSDSVSDQNNLWPHKTKWDMTIDHTSNPSLSFSIPAKGLGVYTVSFDAQVFPQDKSEETRTHLYFYYDDKTPTGRRTNVVSEYYIKDSIRRGFTYKMELNDSLVTHLNGALYDHGGERKNLTRKAIFSNISITFESSKSDTISAIPRKKHKFYKNNRIAIKPIEQ